MIRSQHKSTAASRTLADELDEWVENTHEEGKVPSDNSSEWSSNTHTREIPTNAFGKVSFSQDQQDEGVPAKVQQAFTIAFIRLNRCMLYFQS